MNYEINGEKIKVNISLLTGDIELKGTSRTDISVDFDELRKGTAEEIFDIKFENNELMIAQKNKKLSQYINMESLFPFPSKYRKTAFSKPSWTASKAISAYPLSQG